AVFTALAGAIRYGLAALKGIGQTSVNAIIEARNCGPFKSFTDFIERMDSGAINRRVLESLIAAGAFDSLMATGCCSIHSWRARLTAAIDSALSRTARAKRQKTSGQNALFAPGDDDSGIVSERLP